MKQALRLSDELVAELLAARTDEIVFTGGGSEASNHAIKGTILQPKTDWGRNAHIIISAAEQPYGCGQNLHHQSGKWRY